MWFSQCMKTPGDTVKRCATTRDAMDACVESGERRRFLLDNQCNRWKRQFQACMLEYGADNCGDKLSRLGACVQESLAAEGVTVVAPRDT